MTLNSFISSFCRQPVACLLPLILVFSGCVTPRNPIPEGGAIEGSVAGQDINIRCFLSLDQTELDQNLEGFLDGMDLTGGADGEFVVLQLSGGGEYGAFGAGVINGWSTTGKRPQFDLVTGISTGALIAPLAFLGKEYDEALKNCYTEISAGDVFRLNGLSNLIIAPMSAVSSTPLKELVQSIISVEVMDAIASEHQKGRRLLMATSYLDEQRFVIWDIGKIASSGKDGALDLIHQVMLASAAIPVAFPPVLFEVDYQGELFDEMHVDGSVFSSTVGVELFQSNQLQLKTPRRSVYYIINWPIGSIYQPVKRRLSDIGFNTFATMLKNQHRWDLFRTYIASKLADFDFQYHGVPDDMPPKKGLPFDKEYMNLLYERGFNYGSEPESWNTLSLLETSNWPDQ